MKSIFTLILALNLVLAGCAMQNKDQIEEWKEEVRQTEKAFASMVAEKGLHQAFVAFASDDAVLLRGDKLIKGKAAIDSLYTGYDFKGLEWTPDHIDIAESGDLAYTYGQYTQTYTDKDGSERQSTGVFHTVWKRQKDGSWKYVWD